MLKRLGILSGVVLLCILASNIFGCRRSQDATQNKKDTTAVPKESAKDVEATKPEDVEAVKAATKEAIERAAGKDAPARVDLSYITPELLREYRSAKRVPHSKLAATRPGVEGGPSVKKGPDGPWTYYGHHIVVLDSKTGEMAWTNSNPDYSHPDRPDYRCYGDHRWSDYISQYYPYDSCPKNSQGENSASFGADPKL